VPGFDHDPDTYVQLIQQNLGEDRYPIDEGYRVILKELIQNADDAGASRLCVGWVPGVPQAGHPLLRGPGMFAMNDAELADADERALRRFGIGAKPSSAGKIGKFGLGLKSVFHLCEAFFYVCSHPTKRGVLSPWFSNQQDVASIHADWDEFTEHAAEMLRSQLRPLRMDGDWFCLWLPLRRKAHQGEWDPIAPLYPGESGRPNDGLFEIPGMDVARLLPMLASLSDVSLWLPDSAGALAMTRQMSLATGSVRRRDPRLDLAAGMCALEGSAAIVDHRGSERAEVTYTGFEQTVTSRRLDELRESGAWRSYAVIDSTTNQTTRKREIPHTHCAVYFTSHNTEGAGDLECSWCVFLPLRESLARQPLPSASIGMFLHGTFAVDPGRSAVRVAEPSSGEPTDEPLTEARLYGQWNRALAEDGVMRLVLPALDSFARRMHLSDDRVAALTKALDASWPCAEWLPHICSDSQWAYCLKPEGGKWRLVPRAQPLYYVPRPPDTDPQCLYEMLPGIKEVCRDHAVTFAGHPAIAEDKGSPLPAPLLQATFMLDADALFSDTERVPLRLEYLRDFLAPRRGAKLAADSQLLRQCISAIQEVLARAAAGLSADAVVALKRLVGLLPAKSVMALQLPDDATRRAYATHARNVVTAPTDCVVVPAEYVDERFAQERGLPVDDAVRILDALAPLVGAREATGDVGSLVHASAVAVLGVVRLSDVPTLVERCGDTPLYRARRAADPEARLRTIRELQEADERGRLYAGSLAPTAPAMALCQAIADDGVIVVQDATAYALHDANICAQVPRADLVGCVTILGSAPALAPPSFRTRMLDHLRGRLSTHRLALRYLLHGRSEPAGDPESAVPLYTPGPPGIPGVWSELLRKALEEGESEWRIVPLELTRRLSPADCEALRVRTISLAEACACLRGLADDRLRAFCFSDEERFALLMEAPDDCFRRLPIHEDVHGCLRPIDDDTHVATGAAVIPAAIAGAIVLLKPHENVRIRARQDEHASPLTPERQLGLLLNLGPEAHTLQACMDIMDLLEPASVTPTATAMRQGVVPPLRRTQWLHTRAGQPVAPSEVIHLPTFRWASFVRLASIDAEGFTASEDLHDDIRGHRSFHVLAGMFPDTGDAVAMVGQALAGDPAYTIGEIWGTREGSKGLAMRDFQIAFRGAGPEVTLAHGMVKAAITGVGEHVASERLLPALSRPLSVDMTAAVLQHLAGEHAVRGSAQAALFGVHLRYLEHASRQPGFTELVRRVDLLSEAGSWERAAKLCYEGEGIDAADVLDARLRSTFSNLAAAPGPPPVRRGGPGSHAVARDTRPGGQSTADALATYFSGWRDRAPAAALGGLVALLGGHVERYASAYLAGEGRTIEKVLQMYEWRGLHADVEGAAWDIHESVRKSRVEIEIADSDTVEMPSLVGTTFDARIADESRAGSLLVGRLAHEPFSPIYQAKLRPVKTDGRSRDELVGLLRQTAAAILKSVYRRVPENMDDVWEELGKGQQLDIHVAQRLILESAFFYLRQLDLGSHHELVEAFRNGDRARRLKAEEEGVSRVRVTSTLADEEDSPADAKMAEARAQLERLLVHDPKAQTRVLEAIRDKVRDHYQYGARSTLFELFQNADDACVELGELRNPAQSPRLTDIGRFVVRRDGTTLQVVHWGRRINEYRSLSPDGALDGQTQGYDRDLQKMLVLSTSDKTTGSAAVTGRFGLGFKTVLLLTSRPRVLSGLLGFEVLGGVYPEALSADVRDGLEAAAKGVSTTAVAAARATVIEMPRAAAAESEAAMDAFVGLMHVLVVFGRAIGRCEVYEEGDLARHAYWDPRLLAPGVSIGPLLREAAGPTRGLHLQAETEHAGILMGLCEQGFVRFADHVPTVWVTAPTQDVANLGFLVNGPFALDIGRAQLAKGSLPNERAADRLGADVGRRLCALHDLCFEDWPGMTAQMGLSDDVDAYDLWVSLWGICAGDLAECAPQERNAPAIALAKRVLWGADSHGMRRLVSSREALPTGLWGAHRALTRIDAVRFVAQGALDTRETFEAVAEWDFFRERVPPGSAVSESSTWRPIGSLGVPLPAHRNVDIDTVVAWATETKPRVDPVLAEQLGEVVTPEFLSSDLPSRADLLRVLRSITFLAQDDSYRAPNSLLADHSDAREESDHDPTQRVEDGRLSTLAPPGRVLAGEYGPQGRAFYHACRYQQPTDVSRDDVLQWVLDARDDGSLNAPGLVDYLRDGRHRGWLFEQLPHHGLHGLSPRARALIDAQTYEPLAIAAPPHATDPGAQLDDIHEWWTDGGDAWLGVYDSRVYPDGQLGIHDGNADSAEPETRVRWLTLLLLGAFQSMGFPSAQAHRTFLREHRDWLDALIEAPSDVDDWAAAYVSYLGRYQKYIDGATVRLAFYRWSLSFLSGVQFRHWLADYVHAFRAVNRMDGFSLDDVLRPRASARFQGGGPSAPPIDGPLGIGATFVMRELVRHGVIDNAEAHRYCYVPTRRVRRAFTRLGLSDSALESGRPATRSEAIHRFLVEHMGADRATFGLGFDIPLLRIAEDAELQNRFLRGPIDDDGDRPGDLGAFGDE
jgi:hypothetical protein